MVGGGEQGWYSPREAIQVGVALLHIYIALVSITHRAACLEEEEIREQLRVCDTELGAVGGHCRSQWYGGRPWGQGNNPPLKYKAIPLLLALGA